MNSLVGSSARFQTVLNEINIFAPQAVAQYADYLETVGKTHVSLAEPVLYGLDFEWRGYQARPSRRLE
jgi:hypothetical protein